MKKKIWFKIVSLVLVISTLLTTLPVAAFATEINGETYIKEIKLIQTDNKSSAKQILGDNGYTFYDANLNEGTDGEAVWLGYKTTTDPSEAVYDMKLMNMKGGFSRTSMEKALESQKSALSEMATDLDYLVDEFVVAYKVGSAPAKSAYKALNFFRVVDGETELLEENGLGYQIVSGNVTISMLTELLLFCDPVIVDTIVKLLNMGIQTRNGNWLQKLSDLGPYDSGVEYMEDDEELLRRAEQLLGVLQMYSDIYNIMEKSGLLPDDFDENMNPIYSNDNTVPDNLLTAEESDLQKTDEARYKFYKLAADELEKYPYGDDGETLLDFFISLADEDNEKVVYPLASILSNGEFAAFTYGCFLELVTSVGAKDKDFSSYDEVYATLTEEQSSVYLYHGVDKALFDDEAIVGFTDTAQRHMAQTGELNFFESENVDEAVWAEATRVVTGIGVACMAVIGLTKIGVGAIGILSSIGAVTVTKTGALAATIKYGTMIGGLKGLVVAVVVVVLSLVISYVVAVVKDNWSDNINWEKDPLLDYIYDVKEVSFTQTTDDGIQTNPMKRAVYTLYEAVTDVYGDRMELNALYGEGEWLQLFVSYDRQGDNAKPIKSDSFKVQTGNGEIPNGYVPLTRFGDVYAYNLNAGDLKDRVNGIYMFYQQDQELAVDSGVTYYISEVQLQTGESDAHCIKLLQDAGYTPVNVNLSPDLTDGDLLFEDKVYTYIGYKVTTSKTSAIRDIRLVYGSNQGSIQFGATTYAACGSNGVVTLYATKYKNAGTPILAGSLTCVNEKNKADLGYEPICLISGGPAVPVNINNKGEARADNGFLYLYFLPERTFTSGKQYLGGIAVFQDGDYLYNAFTTQISMPDVATSLWGDYIPAAWAERGTFNTYERYIGTVYYYPTYNPYRAIYSIKGVDLEGYTNSTAIEGTSYYIWNRINWGFEWHKDSPDKDKDIKKDTTLVIRTTGVDEYRGKSTFYLAGNPNAENVYLADSTSSKIKDKTKDEMSEEQPIQLSDILIFETSTDYKNSLPDTFNPVVSAFSSNTDLPMYYDNVIGEFVIYTKTENKNKPYISSISAVDQFSLYRANGGAEAGLTLDLITDSMLYSTLVSKGVTDIVSESGNMYKTHALYQVTGTLLPMNKTKFGFTRTSTSSKALRDVFLYFNGFSTDEPPQQIYRGTAKYTLLCEIPYNLMSSDEAPYAGVYLYGTTSSKSGERITDFTISTTPFMEGYETVRTQDGRSLMSAIKDYAEYQKMSNPMGKAQKFFEALYNFFDNDDKTSQLPYYYLHIKREKNTSGDDLYIENLYLANVDHDKESAIESLFDQGADGYVEIDLNEDAGGDCIYLGYSYTEDPAKAIKEIRAYHSKSHPATMTDDSGRKFTLVKDLDLNKGAGGDCIYLYTTKGLATDEPITKVFAAYKVATGKETQMWADGTEVSATIHCTKQWNSSKDSDLNRKAGGEYVYLMYTTVNSEFIGTAETIPSYGKDKTYTRDDFENKAEDGKYIGGLYVMDKETIRLEKVKNGTLSASSTCQDITDDEVITRLKAMGATATIETPVLVNSGSYFKNNANKIFIGYSRTNDLNVAIRNIAIKAEILSLDDPKEEIIVKDKAYFLVAQAADEVTELPKAINLIGIENGQNLNLPRLYLYYSTSTGSDPIYDISIDDLPIVNGWNTVRSANILDPFTDIYQQAYAMRDMTDKDEVLSKYEEVYKDELSSWMDEIEELFDPEEVAVKPFYIHVKRYTQKTIEEVKPYIGEVFLAAGDSKHEALVKLVAYEPDGFVDTDLNDGAGGDYVYMAYKRVGKAKDALRDMVVYEGKKFEPTRTITIDGKSAKFKLVADIDLNKDAGGKYLYLYTTDSKYVGNPIMNLSVKKDSASYSVKCGVEQVPVRRADGNQYTDEYIDLNKSAGGKYLYLMMTRETTEGHDYSISKKTEDVPATCGKDGSLTLYYECGLCGASYKDVTKVYPATGDHTDEKGDGDHECDVCGLEEVTDHVPGEAQKEGVKAPTCIAKGYYYNVVYCKECEEELEYTIVYTDIDPNNHKDGNDADHNCDRCGALNIEDHTPGKPVEENRIEPTESTDGSYKKVIYCTECGKVISEETIVIPALNKAEPDDNELLASLFGDGSIIIIGSFFGLAVLAAIVVYLQKKKKINKGENKDE